MPECPTLEDCLPDVKRGYLTNKGYKVHTGGRYIKLRQGYDIVRPDVLNFLPAPNIIRLPAHVMGIATLGRQYGGDCSIQIADEYQGSESSEIDVHETLHYLNPQKREEDIRELTRNKFSAPIYH